jgi:Leucine-rich repeat (LRR) protein
MGRTLGVACLLLLLISVAACRRETVESKPAQSQVRPAASVKELAISDQNESVLKHLEDYPALEVLSMECLESLQSLPDSIGDLPKLRELRIDNGNGCVMNPSLPESFGNLHSLETLVLYGAQDPRFGDESGPQPQERHPFPKSMSQLKNLTYIDLGRNGFEEVPSFVGDLSNLRELGLGWNNLQRAANIPR